MNEGIKEWEEMLYCVLDDVMAFGLITLVNSVALSFVHFAERVFMWKNVHICVNFMKMSEFKRKPQLQTEI